MLRIRLAPIAAAGRLLPAILGCAACVLATVCWAGAAAAGDRPAGRSAVRAGIQTPAQSDRVAGVLDAFARADGDERVRQALDIFFNDPEAKLALKRDASLGRAFHDVMAGRDGASGLAGEALATFRQRMKDAGYADDLIARYVLIRNAASVGSAPMDIDIGALAGSEAEIAALRKQIGGPAEIAELHKTSQRLLEDAWTDVATRRGLSPPGREALSHWLAATSPWHPEAYLASQVLKEGGIPGRSLLQQTADVTIFKINHWAKAAGSGADWAAIEMARATLKDLGKVERVFDEVERLTGTRPVLKDQGLTDLLRKIAGAQDGRQAVEALTAQSMTVERLAERCRALAGNMESAVVLAPTAQVLKARFYATRLSGETLQQALRAVLNRDGALLPEAARALDRELSKVAGLYLVSLSPDAPQEFVRRLAAEWRPGPAGFRLGVDDVAIRQFLERQLEVLPESELAVWFDARTVERLSDLRGRMTPEVKRTLAARISRRLPTAEIDRRITTTLLAGDAQAAGGGAGAARGLLFFDGAIGAATALIETGAIMDEGLPPEVERRRIADAWTRAIPVIGDVYAAGGAFGAGGWQYLEGVLYVALAASYLVPQVQVPALVATLGLATYSVGSSLYDAAELRRHIGTWIASGAFDPATGRLMGLYDADHRPRQALRQVPDRRMQAAEDRRALEAFYVNGDQAFCCQPPLPASIGAPAGAPMPAMATMRASLLDYAERAFRVSRDPNVEATRTAITAVYPSFDLDAALAQPRDAGRLALEKAIRADNAAPTRTPAWALYRQLERIYEEAALAAIRRLTREAEREYQATHMVGEAAAVFARLNAIGGRLRLPLLAHVDQIHNSSFELVKGVWDEHSRPVQRLDLAKSFADGYAAIEASIGNIGDTCRRYGVNPPDRYWLSGFLSIDRPRLDDLERAYRLALTDTDEALRNAAAKMKVPYDRTQACPGKIFRELAQLRVNGVYARDYALLLSEWSGNVEAAERSRDEALSRIQSRLSRNEPVASTLTKLLYQAQELVLGWRRENWADQGVFAEGAAAFQSARAAAAGTQSRLEAEYSAALATAGARLAACAGATASLEDVVTATLTALGYSWQRYDLNGQREPTQKGGYLQCGSEAGQGEGCMFLYVFEPSEQRGMTKAGHLTGREFNDKLVIKVGAGPAIAGAAISQILGNQGLTTHREYPALVKEQDTRTEFAFNSGRQAQLWALDERASELLVQARSFAARLKAGEPGERLSAEFDAMLKKDGAGRGVMIDARRYRTCVGVEGAFCSGVAAVAYPYREVDRLLDALAAAGLVQPPRPK